MKTEMKVWSLALCSILALPWAAAQTIPSAPTAPTPVAATAATVVPALIPYSGTALDSHGNALTAEKVLTFLIYKDEQGGAPLFTESQTVTPDRFGHYKAQLGASLPSGIPISLFASGEARWLEVQIAGEQPQPRVLLVSVPYALKAADAATLDGLPASAFSLAGSRDLSNVAGNEAAGVVPNAASTVTTTGGTANKIAKFSGANTIVNSIVYDNGTDVGIGTTSPTATLTVNGTAAVDGMTTLNGAAVLNATGTATSAHAYNSQLLKAYTSAYNSSTKAVVQPRFEWQAEATGNNTSAPSGTLNLLASTTSANAAETGFYFNSDGTIHFAAGQTFDGNTTIEANTIDKTGILGFSTGSSGVFGISTAGAENGGDNAAVVGSSVNSSGAGIGVFGNEANLSSTFQSCRNVPGGAGIWGDSNFPLSYSFTPGVIGTADDQYAGFFANNSPGIATLFAENNVESSTATLAYLSGYYGLCTVDTSGDLYCTGSKSAVVPVDNNTRKVALYAVESPENWFEDFGSGQLSNGVATIELEPVFAQTVNLGVDYHVFLTPNGDSKGLYISSKTPTSFEVRESGSGRSSLAFDYRIVARRKGYETLRLADKTKDLDRSRSPRMMSAQRVKHTKQ